jgi:hypothetical protein
MRQTPFSYARLRERRDRILNRALRPYINANIVGNTVTDMCRDILAELPDSVSPNALFDSVRLLAGTQLSRKAASEFAWRLAGNIDRLIDGLPVLAWTRQIADEKVPVCVEHVRSFHRKKTPGFIFHCRALAGTPCPTSFTQFFSQSSCKAIARTLGFSAPWGPYPYTTALHFVNLLFFAHIEAEKSGASPAFNKVSASSSMIKNNRSLIEIRTRAQPCPLQYEHSCAHCWVGYDQCSYAVHARTYVTRHCANCNADGFFDPVDNGVMCVRCKHAAAPHEAAH